MKKPDSDRSHATLQKIDEVVNNISKIKATQNALLAKRQSFPGENSPRRFNNSLIDNSKSPVKMNTYEERSSILNKNGPHES